MKNKTYILLLFILINNTFTVIYSQSRIRIDSLINNDWLTNMHITDKYYFAGFEKNNYDDKNWIKVNIPHNWDQYGGYRRIIHGNLHGYAYYRKNIFIKKLQGDKRYFLWFEGVGSYATVWINGIKVAEHAGGRTSFTIDITNYIKFNKQNLIAVRADHPSNIRDLPWVCGGCSDEWGFSEGSQPMGIFRPVHLIVTNSLRIEPFGVHIWNDTTVTDKNAKLFFETEIRNYSTKVRKIEIISSLRNKKGKVIANQKTTILVNAKSSLITGTETIEINNPVLWSIENPYLYVFISEIFENGKLIDCLETPYGIRTISWPIGRNNNDNRFYLNGKPVFINGTAEYEHLLGNSHAFSDEQIKARVMQIKSAGFNAFRDAHQPHNLRYHANWDSLGILWWPQFAAHIWFDNNEFRENFKKLLTDWVKERRNSPSIILWGLENESTLPIDFAIECTEIIRKLDPTTSSQRKVTTCNGGTGTDWNVIQNWSGTYAGNLYLYDSDLTKEILNGEYGAWRSIDLHDNVLPNSGFYNEERMCHVMETKIRLAEAIKDKCCGHFQWIFNSHDNPGRTQNGEGFREIDRIGPVNYKGLITPWGEFTDAYYLYRSNYISSEKEPMVYIVSHTWPNRWINAGNKDSIIVYSNCEEVELFNDLKYFSFGKKKNQGKGTHFQWDNVNIKYNILYARGYNNGNMVAEDIIVLNHLPKAPNFKMLLTSDDTIINPKDGYYYLYRVNCGGPNYKDKNGNLWLADKHLNSDNSWGSKSWVDDYEGLPPFYASQRRIFDPIRGTNEWKLFQTFRYGRNKLIYSFDLPDGEYLIELYFIEPWYGTDAKMDCSGWRLFDIAINDEIVINDFDIWKEVGHDKLIKKSFIRKITGGKLVISFPEVKAGQALISAIAVASKNQSIRPIYKNTPLIINFSGKYDLIKNWELQSWLDIGDRQYCDSNFSFYYLPPVLYSNEWIRTSKVYNNDNNSFIATFNVSDDADVFVSIDTRINKTPEWLKDFYLTDLYILNDNSENNRFKIFCKRYTKGSTIYLGSNANNEDAQMYNVFVCPVNILGQASEFRPKITYEAENAYLNGNNFIKDIFKDKKFIKIPETPDTYIEWEISVGIGDTYSILFKYLNNTDSIIPMNLIINDDQGRIIKKETLEFKPKKEAWNILKTNTGTSINAGKYKLKLVSMGKGSIGIDAIEVQ
jgi:hypothetical protein